MSALVSCIIPLYNGERFLREAIESVLAQHHRPIEIIVADDGSTDGSWSILADYAASVRIVSQSTSGPAATRNLGLRAAQGEFVAFLDADDLWHPRKLELQMARFTVRSDLEACVTLAQLFWTDEASAEAERYRDHPRAQPLPGYATTTLLARRHVFDVVGEFRTELWFGDATDWFVRASEAGVVLELLPEVLTYHRMHGDNLTRRRSRESRDEFLRIVKDSLERRRSGLRERAPVGQERRGD